MELKLTLCVGLPLGVAGALVATGVREVVGETVCVPTFDVAKGVGDSVKEVLVVREMLGLVVGVKGALVAMGVREVDGETVCVPTFEVAKGVGDSVKEVLVVREMLGLVVGVKGALVATGVMERVRLVEIVAVGQSEGLLEEMGETEVVREMVKDADVEGVTVGIVM